MVTLRDCTSGAAPDMNLGDQTGRRHHHRAFFDGRVEARATKEPDCPGQAGATYTCSCGTPMVVVAP